MRHVHSLAVIVVLGAITSCRTSESASNEKDLRFISTNGDVEIISLKDDVVLDKMCAAENPSSPCECAVTRQPDSMNIKEYLSHISYGDTGLWVQTEKGKADLTEAYNDASAAAATNPKAAAEAPKLKKYLDNMDNILTLKKSLSQGCINVRSFAANYDFLRAPFVAKQKAKSEAEALDRATMKQCDVTVYTTPDKSPTIITAGLNINSSLFNFSADPLPLRVTENQISCFTPAMATDVGLIMIAASPACRLTPNQSITDRPTNTQKLVATNVLNNNTILYYFAPTDNNGRINSTLPTRISNNAPYCYTYRRIPIADFQ